MRLFSGRSRVCGSKASRLLVAAALAGSLPLAVAQRPSPNGSYPGHIAAGYSGHVGGGSYGHSLAGYAAPNFVSTFGPHSITGTAGANFVAPSGRLAPDFASSWGIAHPVGLARTEVGIAMGAETVIMIAITTVAALATPDTELDPRTFRSTTAGR